MMSMHVAFSLREFQKMMTVRHVEIDAIPGASRARDSGNDPVLLTSNITREGAEAP
jgi:hypothetical protein